jgi:hypothetical protein
MKEVTGVLSGKGKLNLRAISELILNGFRKNVQDGCFGYAESTRNFEA